MIYAVIDTNVIVSALITKNPNSPVMDVMRLVFSNAIQIIVNNAILSEYREVLYRPKFELKAQTIEKVLSEITAKAINIEVPASGVILPDLKDVPFYDVALAHQDKNSSLVTGNAKHFPNCTFAVTPRDFLKIVAASLAK